jgi:hypothetical protein
MVRAANDNELLAASRVQRAAGAYAAVVMVAIGCVWYLCVAYRAGAFNA